jgi:hypothetical protein
VCGSAPLQRDIAQRDDVRAFVAAECTRESGVLPRELTPTRKVKRRSVEARYAALIAEFESFPNADVVAKIPSG